MKKLEFEIDGQKIEGLAEMLNGVLWLHLNGENFTYEVPKKGSRRGGRQAAVVNPGEVLAPMPGKITKISVKGGELVQTGQVLLVLEAMKMEYTLKAPSAGVVGEIKCQPGQQVALNQLLVQLKPAQN